MNVALLSTVEDWVEIHFWHADLSFFFLCSAKFKNGLGAYTNHIAIFKGEGVVYPKKHICQQGEEELQKNHVETICSSFKSLFEFCHKHYEIETFCFIV